jgi:hypothetical protein
MHFILVLIACTGHFPGSAYYSLLEEKYVSGTIASQRPISQGSAEQSLQCQRGTLGTAFLLDNAGNVRSASKITL